MKEIQGKIKFGVYEIYSGLDNIEKDFSTDEIILSKKQINEAVFLSEITEEQAAEFVEDKDVFGAYRDYFAEKNIGWSYIITTAKESLISLLKANDMWIKKWYAEEYEHLPIMRKNLCDNEKEFMR